MRSSTYLSRFLTLLFCIVSPLYLAIRGSASLSEIELILSSLSDRVDALHNALTSPLGGPLTPVLQEAFEASVEPPRKVHSPEKGKRKTQLTLPDGLAHCINSFEQYPLLANQVIQRKYARYAAQTPAQKALSEQLGYLEHFQKARDGIEKNARFSKQVAQIAREQYRISSQALEDSDQDADYGVVNLAFGHISRDWSSQGARERQAVFPPILSELEQHFGGDDRGTKKVLVPGSGMGRLASDIADLGVYHLS